MEQLTLAQLEEQKERILTKKAKLEIKVVENKAHLLWVNHLINTKGANNETK